VKIAIRNLLLCILLMGILLIFTWVYLRGSALSKTVRQPMSHPLLAWIDEHPSASAAFRGGDTERPENTIEALEHAAAIDNDLLLWIDVRPSNEGTLFVFNDRDLASTTNGQGWLSMTSDSVIRQLDAGFQFKNQKGEFEFRGRGLRIPTLVEVLAKFPNRKFILNIHDYQNGLDAAFVSAIEKSQAAQRVLFTSPEDAALRDLREKRPDWIFGTSQAEVTRLKMLSSFALESVPPLRGDIFVAERPEISTKTIHPQLSKEMIQEVHRRRMKIVAGPALAADAPALRQSGVDIVLVRDPSKLIKP
jgi:glycerophosphoryl diester phosphodiesterase